jgi:hypothetical protein
MAYKFESIKNISIADTISENLNLLAEQDGKTVRLNSTVIPKLDDTKVSEKKTWSSKKIINSLCPTLEEREPVIKCFPLVESPLEVTSYIESKQDGTGTPSPDNIRPISGSNTISLTRRKKNLFNAERVGKIENWDISKTYGYIDLNIPVGKYILSYSPQVTSLNGHIALMCKQPATSSNPLTSIINSSGGVSAKSTIFEVLDGERIYLNWYVSSVAGAKNQTALNDFMNSVLINAQIEQGDVQTDYEPYQGNTYTADLNETVYGGSYNWATGALTKDCGIMTIDENTAGIETRSYGFIIRIPDVAREQTASENKIIKAVSNMKSTAFNTVYVKKEQYIISAGYDFNGVAFYTNDEHLNNIDAVRAWLAVNPITFVYRKIQQTTTQFESINIKAIDGENFLYSNCGETKVKYDADIEKYVDKAIEEATKENEYELIETITTENESVVVRTEEPDGEKYNFVSCLLLMRTADTEGNATVSVYLQNSKSGDNIVRLSLGKGAANNYGYVKADKRNGMWEYSGRSLSADPSTLANFFTNYNTLNLEEKNSPVIDRIQIFNLPIGSTITIKGVRANA